MADSTPNPPQDLVTQWRTERENYEALAEECTANGNPTDAAHARGMADAFGICLNQLESEQEGSLLEWVGKWWETAEYLDEIPTESKLIIWPVPRGQVEVEAYELPGDMCPYERGKGATVAEALEDLRAKVQS